MIFAVTRILDMSVVSGYKKNTVIFRRLALPPFSGGTEKGAGLRLASTNGLIRAGSPPFPFPPEDGCR